MTNLAYTKYFDIESLIKDIKGYLTDFDEKLFRKAFDFAEKAHEGQIRKDNETPYIAHPVGAAGILAGLHADEDILISALLHDVPEDTKHGIDEIKSFFGEKIAFLVDGITKLSAIHYQHDMPQRDVESLKKLFLHSAKDPRVILIKLADRLHNMRTLQYVSELKKRIRISRETLEIFVPMANLLGIQGLKSELEDLCFKYLFPTEYEQLSNLMASRSKKIRDAFKKTIVLLTESLKKNKISGEISERKQNFYTVYKKLCTKGKAIGDTEARIAIRIIVKIIPECYEVLGIVHGLFTPKVGKFKDYIASPKMNKYQSLHTMVFGVSGILTEVQIRTEEMHIEADYGIAANFFSQKNNLLKKDTRSLWVNRVIEMENTENTAGGFLENLKCDILQDRIFVFTNKGESIDLPKGATVIDFAYCVHTDIGNHAVKAEINGKLMPVTTRLNLGEVVNVIVNKNATPSLSWLNFVKTRVAKEKICLYLRKIGKDRKIREGYKILQKEFDIAGLGLFKNFNFKKINFELEKKLNKKFNAVEDLCVAVSEGNVRAVDVVNAIKKPLIKNVKGMKVNIKVVAKNRFGLLREVSEVFYKHSLDMIYLKGWGSSKSENAYFNVQVVVSSIESINYIFDELEQVDGVKYVYRIPYRVVYLLSFLMFLVGAFWIFHPFVLNSIMKSGRTIEETGYMVNLTIYSCLFVLFMIILYVANIAKNHLPYMRNKKMLIILSFGVPALAFITLLIELFYFQLKLNWPTLIIELVIIYTYLGISFRNLKKYT